MMAKIILSSILMSASLTWLRSRLSEGEPTGFDPRSCLTARARGLALCEGGDRVWWCGPSQCHGLGRCAR